MGVFRVCGNPRLELAVCLRLGYWSGHPRLSLSGPLALLTPQSQFTLFGSWLYCCCIPHHFPWWDGTTSGYPVQHVILRIPNLRIGIYRRCLEAPTGWVDPGASDTCDKRFLNRGLPSALLSPAVANGARPTTTPDLPLFKGIDLRSCIVGTASSKIQKQPRILPWGLLDLY